MAAPPPWVTVLTVSRPLDAQLSRARLEAHGIDAFIPDEQVASIDPLMLDAMGGVRVQVRSHQADQAQSILKQRLIAPEDLDDDPEDDSPRCPACNSNYIASANIMMVLLTGSRKTQVCQRCEHRFQLVPAEAAAARSPYRTGATVAREGRPVFRLRRNASGTGLLIGIFLGPLLSLALGVSAPLAVAAGGIVGFWLGTLRRADYCSDPDCRHRLPQSIDRCEGCDGRVEWVIHRAGQHYVAKHTWRQGQNQLSE